MTHRQDRLVIETRIGRVELDVGDGSYLLSPMEARAVADCLVRAAAAAERASAQLVSDGLALVAGEDAR